MKIRMISMHIILEEVAFHKVKLMQNGSNKLIATAHLAEVYQIQIASMKFFIKQMDVLLNIDMEK